MKKIIPLGIVSFIVFILIKAPVSLLLPYINNPYFQVTHIDGSIFSAEMTTTGKIDHLSYQFNPFSLLLLNLSAKVQASKAGNTINTKVIFDLISQSTQLSQTTGNINLSLLQTYLPILSTVEPKGQLLLKELKVSWGDVQNSPVPQKLSGKITVSKLNALEQNFGDYQLDINTKSNNIIGVLVNKKSATTTTKLTLNLSPDKKQMLIFGKIVGNNANTKVILEQLNIGNIQRTIQY